jgi:hypothetical protein
MSDMNRRLNAIEKRLGTGKESRVVPLVIVTQCDENTKSKGIEIVYGDAEKQENEQKTIEAD